MSVENTDRMAGAEGLLMTLQDLNDAFARIGDVVGPCQAEMTLRELADEIAPALNITPRQAYRRIRRVVRFRSDRR